MLGIVMTAFQKFENADTTLCHLVIMEAFQKTKIRYKNNNGLLIIKKNIELSSSFALSATDVIKSFN